MRIAELKSRMATGSVIEGIIRALIYVGRPRAAIDERGFEAIRRMRELHGGAQRLTLAEFKAMLRDQAFLLLLDPVASRGRASRSHSRCRVAPLDRLRGASRC